MLTLERLRFARAGFTLKADLSLAAGARVAVLGPSGGGKSTLLDLIAGFEAPAAGRVLWEGQDMAGAAPGDRPVSILFQEGNLFPHLTLFENTALGIDPRLKLTPAQREEVSEILEDVGLGGLETRKPGALSGGQRARAALARVFLRARPVLLLDEAFSALGPALKSDMFDLLERLVPDETVLLMVTHDPEEAARMSEIVVVDEGRVAPPESGGPLLADPPPGLARYLGRR